MWEAVTGCRFTPMRAEQKRKEKIENRKEGKSSPLLAIFYFLFSIFYFLPSAVCAQEAGQEVVANLSAGRVVIYVAKDGIAIAANESRVEADSRPPLARRIAR